MHVAEVATALRRLVARRPWLYWLAAAAVAAAVAWGVQTRIAAADDARRAWVDTRTVVVATLDHEPGDALTVDRVELPLAAVPPSALDPSALDATVVAPRTRQRIGRGEVVTIADITAAAGPAALAEPGTVTVALTGQHGARVGLDVTVVAEGIVLAEAARVVAVEDEVVFVAVDRVDGAAVAAAASTGAAAVLYLP